MDFCYSPPSSKRQGMVSLRITHSSVLLALVAHVASVSITVPATAPAGAVQVAPSLIGFSLEQDRWTDWAGLNSRNQFLFNVLDNLRGLSGEPPFIRIGANSEDHTNYNPNVKVCSCHRVTRSMNACLIFIGDATHLPRPYCHSSLPRGSRHRRWRCLL